MRRCCPLDDIYLLTMPEGVGAVHAIVDAPRIHGAKTKIWNPGGEACDLRCVGAHCPNPESHKPWCGEGPTFQEGIKVMGIPLSHGDFVAQHFRNVNEEQWCLLERIRMVQDV